MDAQASWIDNKIMHEGKKNIYIALNIQSLLELLYKTYNSDVILLSIRCLLCVIDCRWYHKYGCLGFGSSLFLWRGVISLTAILNIVFLTLL